MNSINFNAQLNLNRGEKAVASSMEKLSSGKRINSAADDAAGLAIALKFAAQIVGADQASRNANDGISMMQTADSGLEHVADNLQRMRELAVQSANGTYSAADRNTMQLEYQQNQVEVQHTVESTEFNGHKLLNDPASLAFQVGPNSNQSNDRTVVSTANILANAQVNDALSNSDVLSQTSGTDAIGKIDAALEHVNFERARLGATQNRLESTISNLQVSSENSAAARSRIEDTDYAKQTAELTRALILHKATLAAAAHSNISGQLVAGLLNKSF